MSNKFLTGYFGAQKKEAKKRGEDYNENQNALMRRKRESIREIGDLPVVAHPKRRESCRKNLKRFMTTYMPTAFSQDFSSDHLVVIVKIEQALYKGGLFAFAMPRGSGKTTIVLAAVIFAILYGHRKFIVAIASSDESALKVLDSVVSELENNERIKEDFPEVCYPLEKLEGLAQRAAGQTYKGAKTNMSIKNGQLILPTITGSQSSGIRIKTYGITSKGVRGTHYMSPSGEIIRPDFVILDDPQDDVSARSPKQCSNREKLVKGAILGLAGPGKAISGFMPATVIERGDFTSRMLDTKRNPEWQGLTMKMVTAFPEELEGLWATYAEMRAEGLRHGDNGAEATEFYKANREAMDKGAAVSWESRKKPDELSAIQHAMNLYFRDKATFFAEFQNSPEDAAPTSYSLSMEMVCSRVNGIPRYELPQQAAMFVLFADVNQIGLNYVAAGYDNNFTGWVVDYGKHPEGERNMLWDPGASNTSTEAQAIARGILELVKLVCAKPYSQRSRRVYPTILVDGNYMTETVHAAVSAAARTYPGTVLVDRGRSSRTYRPARKEQIVGQPGSNFHVERGIHGTQVVHNADWFRMSAQKSFLLEPGVPGSLSLWGKDPAEHEAFAMEVCAEKLLEYVAGETREFYEWYRVPGVANDKLDAVTGTRVGAALAGAKLTGGERSWKPRRRPRETRKPKVTIHN